MMAGCGRRQQYRYKLSLAVDTPQGVKRGFSVVEVDVFDIVSPFAKGTASKARGEAVFVDLGAGERPLIAIMSLHKQKSEGLEWAEGKPLSEQLLARFGAAPARQSDMFEQIDRLLRFRRPIDLLIEDLPDLVTFSNINDPMSILSVDPYNLSLSLGPGIRWYAKTLEITDEPVTTGIEKRLPWLAALPSGQFLS